LVLLSPWLDFAEEGASYRSTPDEPILPPPVLDGFKFAYLGDGDRKSSKVTPFYADFTGLPPALVHVGRWERLRDDSIAVVARMKAAGVAADLKIFDGMCHGWQLYAPMLDEGMASLEGSAAFIKSHQTSRLETSRRETSRLAGGKSAMPSLCQVGAPAGKSAY
jgi:acetyl esterase/lipase